MKKTLFFLTALLIFGLGYSQSNLYNFEIENDNGVVYKRVFEKNGNSNEDIISFFNSLSNVNIKDISDGLDGEINDMNINYKKYGGKSMNTLILLNQKMSSRIKIQFKDDKYRIILRDIRFYDDVSLYSVSTSKEADNLTYFSDFVVKKKKGEFKKSKIITKGLDYMNKHFEHIFTFKKSKLDDDW